MTTLTLGVNSYTDQSEADTYCADMGLDAVTDESFLIRATKWVDRNFANRFIGIRLTTDQTLNWPRSPTGEVFTADSGYLTIDSDGNPIHLGTIPPCLKEAVVEVALQMQEGADMYAQPTPAVVEESSAVDVLKSSKKYSSPYQAKTAGDVDLYKIELILRPILSQKGSLRLVR